MSRSAKIFGNPASNAPAGSLSKAMELGLFKGAIPTRSWKPGKVSVARDGIFPATQKCLSAYAPFESSLEARAHLLICTDHRIHSYVCQPPALHYWTPGESGGQDKRKYTPDFVALTRDGRLLVIDAKAKRFATGPEWLRREPYIRSAYRNEFKAEFLIWTEDELCAEPRLSNARTMYRHRFVPADGGLELEVSRALEQRAGLSSIGQLCAEIPANADCESSEVFGAIMRLALNGLVELDCQKKFGTGTIVILREQGK